MQQRKTPKVIELHPHTAPMTFRKLLRNRIYFNNPINNPIIFAACDEGISRIIAAQDSFRHRYPIHNMFLRGRRSTIKTFYDIGAANSLGAPTTIEARHALGKHAKVVAVDLLRAHGDARKKLRRARVDELMHAITRKPLPVQCDAIRFANVVQWMKNEKEVILALKNIWLSLKPGGYLLGATGSYQFILQKVPVTRQTPTGFVKILLPKGFG